MTGSESKLFKLLGLVLIVSSVYARDVQAQSKTDHSRHRPAAKAEQQQVVEISVASDGFVPATVKVRAGRPVKLIVTRKVERTCATDIVIKDYGINKPLPLNVPVEITFTPKKPGTIPYSCAMNMIKGELIAE